MTLAIKHDAVTRSVRGRHRGTRIIPFLLGLGAFVFLSVGGNISLLETVSVLIFLVMFPRIRFRGISGWLLASAAILLVGLAISHRANGDSGVEFGKAVANYGLLVVLTFVLSWIFARDEEGSSITWFLFGAAASQCIGLIVTPTPSSLVDPWKFGLGWSCSVIVLLLLSQLRAKLPRLIIGLTIVALAALNLSLGSRASAALLGTVALILVLSPALRTRAARIATLAISAVGIVAALAVYDFLAERGVLGIAAAAKHQTQSGDYGLLFGARKELVLLFSSWLDQPWIGWGPAADVPFKSRLGALQWFADNHYALTGSDYSRLFLVPGLPLHSILLGILVQVGLLGGLFIVVMLVLYFRALSTALPPRNLALVFLMLSGLIHLFTSPLGDTTRFPVAVVLALGLSLLKTQALEKDRVVSKTAGLPASPVTPLQHAA